MKKLLLVGLAVVLVTVAAAGIASGGAWFTTTEKLEGGNVTTGTLDLAVIEGGLLTVTNIEPGGPAVKAGEFCLKNVGNYDMRFRGWLTDVQDPGGLGQYLRVMATINPNGVPEDEKQYGPLALPMWPTEATIADLKTVNNDFIKTRDVSGVDPFYPGYTVCYRLDVRADASAPNAVQGKTFTANLYLEGRQDLADELWQ